MISPEAVAAAGSMLKCCRVCPRQCRAERAAGATGHCGIAARPRVVSAGAHFGEEPVLVGRAGSGTIFFSGCNLKCVFCQNYDISTFPSAGKEVTVAELAGVMLRLQRAACANINLVTPTHVAPQCLEAIALARQGGLTRPVVYNCGGYESVEMLRLLGGAVDIYMPDFKYASASAAKKYSGVSDYPQVAHAALEEMYRQAGPLEIDPRGLARRGVLVRHLVLPLDLAVSAQVIDIVADAAPACAINVMAQYRPCYRATEFPELLELPSGQEIARLRRHATRRGLKRVD